ncbi:nitrate- and nitrite sensing domain-containing protein, partial [Sulfurimonas sp.]|uniref:nitrate- and nitrite sensing domain-containing protein n=1 Tax=Sulfurimonas sp. TaxID=2022749 RepID=UPI003D13862C
GNSSPNTLRSLTKQRQVVDVKYQQYITYIKDNSALQDYTKDSEKNIETMSKSYASIQKIRTLVDEQKTNFKSVYEDIYGSAQTQGIKELEEITRNQMDPEINELASSYISMVRAKEFTAAERDFISYAIARSTQLQDEEFNIWISLIAKADTLNYDTLQNKALVTKIDRVLK